MSVTILVPKSSKVTPWQQQVNGLVTINKLPTFSAIALDFTNDLSNKILQDKSLRKYPEIISLGYWLRKSNILKLKQEFTQKTEKENILPRGLVLTFAPANVDTIFIYTWILSLLTGNCNIIRISQRETEQVNILLALINQTLTDDKYIEIRNRIMILRYPHNNEITKYLSEKCHLRIVWGGDKSVKEIRSIPLAPLATEIVFPDRFALSVLSAKAILQLPETDLKDLAARFYNDTLFFHQLACSSPRMIYWLGQPEKIKQAKKQFWATFQQVVSEKNYTLPPAVHMARMITGYQQATYDEVDAVSAKDFQIPLCITVNTFKPSMREQHLGAGLFYEYESDNLAELATILVDKDQTITYYGISREAWLVFLSNLSNRSVDRIVPIGQALDFSHIWDGYNLLLSMTRKVCLS